MFRTAFAECVIKWSWYPVLMSVVISGASGLLGQYLIQGNNSEADLHGIVRSSTDAFETMSCEIHRLDLTNFDQVLELLKRIRPEAIIHTAAEGRVDMVQGRVAEYRKINSDLPEFLGAYAQNSGAQFVHLSSNAVFGGKKERYSDVSELSPINDYGLLKAEAEAKVMMANPKAIIVRPILMYGWPNRSGRQNPVTAWLSQLRKGSVIRVVDDVYTEPLAVWDCADVIWQAIGMQISGPLNVSGGETISLFEFARLVASVFELDESLIERATSEDFPSLAPRPKCTTFDLERLKNELGFGPSSLQDGLLRLRQSEPLDEIL